MVSPRSSSGKSAGPINIVGYTLSIPDNGRHMFMHKSERKRCSACSYPLKFLSYNPKFKSSSRIVDRHDGYITSKPDISSTYDLFYIASGRFRDFCLNEGYDGLIFDKFNDDPNYFNLRVRRRVKFDARRRRTTFDKYCRVCKNYESVVGATPSYLLRSSPLSDNFYRTDLIFGSEGRRSPLILVGPETKTKLQLAKLKGLTFQPAYGIE